MEPLKIAILTSSRIPGIETLLSDPDRGAAWELSLAVGSETALADAPVLEQAGVPVELRPLRVYQEARNASLRNLREREEYDDALGELFQRGRIDYVILAGYRYVVTEPLLARFPNRILAIHDADLTLRTSGRLYAGPRAVSDAIFAGEPETRSSIYLVTRDVGQGPLFLLGAPFPLAPMAMDARERGDAAFLTAYAELHRRWMVSTAWGPMLRRTVQLLAGSTFQVLGDTVWLDGAPAPCRMGESPGACHEPEAMVSRGIPRSCPFIG